MWVRGFYNCTHNLSCFMNIILTFSFKNWIILSIKCSGGFSLYFLYNEAWLGSSNWRKDMMLFNCLNQMSSYYCVSANWLVTNNKMHLRDLWCFLNPGHMMLILLYLHPGITDMHSFVLLFMYVCSLNFVFKY